MFVSCPTKALASHSGFSCPNSLRHYLLFSKFLYLWSPKAFLLRTSPVAQMIKCLPTMWETQVQSLGRKDLLEKEMATHSSILAWKIPWTEEPGRLQSMGSQRVGHNYFWLCLPGLCCCTGFSLVEESRG